MARARQVSDVAPRMTADLANAPSRLPTADEMACLRQLERKVLWLSSWMIHNANHMRPGDDQLKVGGHQASCASITTLATALYFHTLSAQDRVAVKPHASPVFHAIQYLLGHQTRDKLEGFRALGGAQAYPSRTKDSDDVDFSTGSVGLGVAMTSFTSLVQDYLHARDWGHGAEGRMVALVGDGELDEGNIYEALLEGWKHDLRNTWWVIDYNRQSLDGVVTEGLRERIDDIFTSMGWQVVTIKYGHKLQAAFAKPGGARLRQWIDDCPNDLYAALCFEGGEAWREHLSRDLTDAPKTRAIIDGLDDAELADLMTNLGGHDLTAVLDAFAAIDHDRPVCFVAYTVKGYGLPLAGHKDNHAGLMTPAQIAALQGAMAVPAGAEWDKFAGLDLATGDLQDFLASNRFAAEGTRRLRAPTVPVPARLEFEAAREASTQEGFGRILHLLGRGDSALADHIITTSPDVTVSTNLGGWVNQRGLYARNPAADTFRNRHIPSAQKWERSPRGQHLELGIAENNLFIALAAMGLSHTLLGERLIPIGTVYDPFIQRGLDALNYACYQDARFMLVATPSGISLAPEGGAHQSIGTPLIGMAQDGLVAFEPAFVDELAAIMRWSFEYMQRDGADNEDRHNGDDETAWLREKTGGSVYLRLSTRKIEQVQRPFDATLEHGAVMGGYWLRAPGPNCELVIVYQGAVAPEAIRAAGMIGNDRRDVAVLAVTSADRLSAGWHAARRARRSGHRQARAYVEDLLGALPPHAGLVTVIDGHPTTLSWLGGVHGHRVEPLGIEHFGQSGTIDEVYRAYEIDSAAIVAAAESLVAGRPVRWRG